MAMKLKERPVWPWRELSRDAQGRSRRGLLADSGPIEL
jgi:hypothetical protein